MLGEADSDSSATILIRPLPEADFPPLETIIKDKNAFLGSPALQDPATKNAMAMGRMANAKHTFYLESVFS